MKREEGEKSQQESLSKREFIKAFGAGAALTGAVAATGGVIGTAQAQEPEPEPEPADAGWDREADVLVIGLGLGGLSASLRALEEGASVICIDKSGRTPEETEPDWQGRNLAKRAAIGGNFNLSGQSIHIQLANLNLPVEKIWEHVRGPVYHVGDPVNPPVMETLVNRAGYSINWLNDHLAGNADGVSLTSMDGSGFITVLPAKDDPWAFWEMRRKPGGPADYTNYGGYKASMILLSKIEAAGGTVLEQTSAYKLITNEDGQVIGARVRPSDGGPSATIKAKAVILNTGGFQKNKELMTRWIGPFAAGWIPSCVHTNTGDGHMMALDVGAQMINLNRSYGVWDPYDARFNPDMIMSYSSILTDNAAALGVWVNVNGDRVFDESGGRWYAADLMARSTDLRHMHIFDNETYQNPIVKATVDAMVEAGMVKSVFTADTLEELSAATVAAADDDMKTNAGWLFSPRLVDTIAEFNAAVTEGTAHRLSPPRSGSARPIATPPYWGIVYLPGTGYTQGGPKINVEGAVLDNNELPIGGLYAAGDIVTGNSMGANLNSHGGYVGGIAPALIWGLVSGESAAAYARTA